MYTQKLAFISSVINQVRCYSVRVNIITQFHYQNENYTLFEAEKRRLPLKIYDHKSHPTNLNNF